MSSPKKLKIISLDVGGQIFKTQIETLTKYPDSALAQMFSNTEIEEQLSKTENGDYFLDLDPRDFEIILKFLRHGKVSSENLSEDVLILADYFGLKNAMTSNVVEPSNTQWAILTSFTLIPFCNFAFKKKVKINRTSFQR